MDKGSSRSMRYRNIVGNLQALITHHRKALADALVPPVPVHPDEIARIRGWICFLTAIALLYRALFFAFWLLLLALILDSVDGAIARKQGLDCPQTDRAMDIFTSFILSAAYLTIYPSFVSITLMLLWVVPKTLWIVRYLKRRFKPDYKFPKIVLWKQISSLLVALQSFPISHTLLLLIFLQWAFKWHFS